MSFLRTLLFLFALAPAEARAAPPVLTYAVDLTHRADDQFRVTLAVSGLTSANAVYQFASTAPGTYQVMDIGRYVREFEALDAAGKPVPTERVSVNQWRLSDPARVRTIRYRMAETWDTPVTEHQVYLMCGTSLEADHALINPHAVIGYPTGCRPRRSISGSATPATGTWAPRSRGTAPASTWPRATTSWWIRRSCSAG